MKAKDFIRWTGSDESGEYSYTGQITRIANGKVHFKSNIGAFGIPVDDGVFTVIRKPKNFKAEKPAVEKKVRKTVTRTKKTGEPTKKEQAMIIFNDLFGKGHGKDVTIQRFMDVLGMSKAGATTYFYNCKKAA